MTKITREEWEAARAADLKMTVEELRAFMRARCLHVIPCECDYNGCEGWIIQMDLTALMRETP